MKLHKILFLIICILLVIVTYDIGATNGKKVKKKKKKKKKKTDDLGLGGTAPVLVCTACTRVIGRIGVDVTKRLEKNDQWSKGLKSKYNTMLQAACANREDFPLNNEIFVKE